MKSFTKLFHRGEKGFTLIELLVVVAILGMIAAVAIPSVSGFIGEGQTEAAKTERDNVQLAVASAMADASIITDVVPLNPSGEIDSSDCTVTYDLNNGTEVNLPVGDYIVGGIESLQYSYSVGIDGHVTAISGPAAS